MSWFPVSFLHVVSRSAHFTAASMTRVRPEQRHGGKSLQTKSLCFRRKLAARRDDLLIECLIDFGMSGHHPGRVDRHASLSFLAKQAWLLCSPPASLFKMTIGDAQTAAHHVVHHACHHPHEQGRWLPQVFAPHCLSHRGKDLLSGERFIIDDVIDA